MKSINKACKTACPLTDFESTERNPPKLEEAETLNKKRN
jgi:hypothetical protein